EELVRRGDRVRVADSLITGKRQNLAHVPDVEFLEGDLADLDVARRAVQGIDYVLHQAAIPSVPRSVKDPLTSNRANITASLNILVAARDAGVKRLIYAGSSSAYGNTPTLPKREDMVPNPLSPYALQKLVAEGGRRSHQRRHGRADFTQRTPSRDERHRRNEPARRLSAASSGRRRAFPGGHHQGQGPSRLCANSPAGGGPEINARMVPDRAA